MKYVWAQVLYLLNFKVKPKSETKCAVLSSFKLPTKLRKTDLEKMLYSEQIQ